MTTPSGAGGSETPLSVAILLYLFPVLLLKVVGEAPRLTLAVAHGHYCLDVRIEHRPVGLPVAPTVRTIDDETLVHIVSFVYLHTRLFDAQKPHALWPSYLATKRGVFVADNPTVESSPNQNTQQDWVFM
jgi:hypothetical protein